MRYFLEVSYDGLPYAGSQIQDNAATVQGELEKALQILYRQHIALTGSSRTDAGVHARQNFYHFDTELLIEQRHIYNLNALLPHSIAINGLHAVKPDAHGRFHALGRYYQYHINTVRDPFLQGRSWYYPYPLNLNAMHEAAAETLRQTHFERFSKTNAQVKTFECRLTESRWQQTEQGYIYHVRANRFLRGMVRALTATMLKVGRGKIDNQAFKSIFEGEKGVLVDFSAPGFGLYLMEVSYPAELFLK
jgi:tRNA pseudouridine38-40 synthase